MYETGTLSETFYQGDVINGFPFVIFDQISNDSFNEEGEALIELKAKLSQVILLSQTCDLQNREYVVVCPVYPLSTVQLTRDNTALVKKRRLNQWFYLPRIEGVIEDSLADFQGIYYVPRTLVEEYKNKKLLSLSDWGRHHLSWALNVYFGRPIENKSS